MEFLTLLSAHVYNVPFWIIWLTGIEYAVIKREEHPRTSLLAGIGLGILLLETVLSAVLTAYFQYRAFSEDGTMAQLGINLTALSVCSLPFSIRGLDFAFAGNF